MLALFFVPSIHCLRNFVSSYGRCSYIIKMSGDRSNVGGWKPAQRLQDDEDIPPPPEDCKGEWADWDTDAYVGDTYDSPSDDDGNEYILFRFYL